MNVTVGLSSKHRLDVMSTIAHDEPVSVSSLGRRRHLLDLKALHDRHGEQLGGLVGIIEDHTGAGQSWGNEEAVEQTYSRAPCESADAAESMVTV